MEAFALCILVYNLIRLSRIFIIYLQLLKPYNF